MKKILLSVIALFAAVSMNAKQDVDISAIGALNTPIKFAGTWEWKGQVISTGDIVRDDAAGTCDDSGVTYFDGSEYDYLFFKYTSTSDKLKCIIQYNTTGVIGEWGPNFNESTKELKASENVGFIELSEFKNTISQVAFQDMGEALELTITEIWFGTKDEVKAALGGGSSEGGSEGGEEGGEEPVAGDWGAVIFNGDCEGEDAGCLLSKDGNDTGNFKWNVKEGAGVDGSNCATVYATGAAENEWDAQFFIYAKDYVFKAGDKFKFSMMIKADKEAEAAAQAHVAPGSYLHYTIIGGPVKFTTEWAEYKFEGEVPAEADGMQTIAFNLNQDKTLENNYYFDNISWEVEGAPTAIQKVQVVKAENGARYNLAGQKVDAAYKGIVIQNGKKFIQK